MKLIIGPLLIISLVVSLQACTGATPYTARSVTSFEGEIIEIDQQSPLTLLFFFSMRNPVSIGELERLSELVYTENVEIIAIARDVDMQSNVAFLQQKVIFPIIIDEDDALSKAFGMVELTPAIRVIKQGEILQQQEGRIDYETLNAHLVIAR